MIKFSWMLLALIHLFLPLSLWAQGSVQCHEVMVQRPQSLEILRAFFDFQLKKYNIPTLGSNPTKIYETVEDVIVKDFYREERKGKDVANKKFFIYQTPWGYSYGSEYSPNYQTEYLAGLYVHFTNQKNERQFVFLRDLSLAADRPVLTLELTNFLGTANSVSSFDEIQQSPVGMLGILKLVVAVQKKDPNFDPEILFQKQDHSDLNYLRLHYFITIDFSNEKMDSIVSFLNELKNIIGPR